MRATANMLAPAHERRALIEKLLRELAKSGAVNVDGETVRIP